ncbi:MAG: hemolysin XhlA family protein [Pseudomonadota bacterium]
MELDRISRLETRISALETQSAIDDVHRENVGIRLGHIEDTLKWLVRLVIGGLLMAAIAFVMQGGLAV